MLAASLVPFILLERNPMTKRKDDEHEHKTHAKEDSVESRLAALEAKVEHILTHMKPIAWKCGVSYTPPPEKQTEEEYKE